MKKSTNSILLSALVFPGAGHIYLKRIKTGLTLLTLSLAAFIYIISDIMRRAFSVVEKIQLGIVPPDTTNIMAMVEQQPSGEFIGLAIYGLVTCWFIGITGCYLLTKK